MATVRVPQDAGERRRMLAVVGCDIREARRAVCAAETQAELYAAQADLYAAQAYREALLATPLRREAVVTA